MILEEELNKLLRDSVNLILGIPNFAIKSQQKDARRPKNSYADVNYLSGLSIGWEQREFENNSGDDDLTENISGMREITFSVGFYKDNARDNARKVRTGFIRESIQDLFRTAKVGLTSRSEVRNISEPLDKGWEERAQLDIVLSVVGTDADIVKSILSVDIDYEYQSRGLVYNSTIEVQ